MSAGLFDIDTPSLLLDRTKLLANISRMQKLTAADSISFRPHVKTAKSAEVIKLLMDDSVCGITVSTVKEAEYFFAHGFSDQIYAVEIVPHKMQRLSELVKRGADIRLLVDNIESAGLVVEKARDLSVHFGVLIEIDCDGHRGGIAPDDARLPRIASLLDASDFCSFAGVLAHAGSSYFSKSVQEIRQCAEQERDAVLESTRHLAEAGLSCKITSIGSSPTVLYGADRKGITEVRAGVYMFQDLFQAGLGVCTLEDIALSVMASVIGYNAARGQVLVDCGWMALSRDRGTAKQAIDQGYGVVCDISGRKIYDEFVLIDAYQEHGVIGHRQAVKIPPDKFPVGSRVRIVPNHACATASQYDSYHVVEDGDVTARWQRCQGW